MAHIRFGPSGNSDLFYEQGFNSTVQAPEWLHSLGLDAYEYSFGRGVRLGEEKALSISKEAQKFDLQVSVHLPYYINLSSEEQDKRDKNITYFLESMKIARALGAKRAVFHPGSASKGTREANLDNAKSQLMQVIDILDDNGFGDIVLCPETMGKINQLGSLEEVAELCGVDERLLPAVDFGHLHSRGQGSIKGKQDYAAILDHLTDRIGTYRTSIMHVHYSRIEFTAGGEKMHRRLCDVQYGPEFLPLAELMFERKMTPVIICESKGTMAEDAAEMKRMYDNYANRV
jgi:deoxyribonuclease-4